MSSKGHSLVLKRTGKFAVNGDYLQTFLGLVGLPFRLMNRCLLAYQPVVFYVVVICVAIMAACFYLRYVLIVKRKKKKKTIITVGLLIKKDNYFRSQNCKLAKNKR